MSEAGDVQKQHFLTILVYFSYSFRQGWESIVQELTKARDSDGTYNGNKDLLMRLEDRWHRMECAFRDGLQSRGPQEVRSKLYIFHYVYLAY